MYLMVLLTTRMARSAPHLPLQCRRLSASLYQLGGRRPGQVFLLDFSRSLSPRSSPPHKYASHQPGAWPLLMSWRSQM